MRKALVFLPIILILFLNITLINNFSFYETTVSDEDTLYFSSLNILEHNSLSPQNTLNSELNTCLITSYIYSIDKNKDLYFNISPTSALFYSYFMSILGNNFFFYFPIIFSSLILMFIFLITYRLTKSNIGSYGVVLLVFFFPVFYKLNLGYYDIIPTVFFLLVSVYFLIPKKPSKKDYLFSSLFFILAISIRISEAIYLFPIILFIFIKENNIKEILLWLTPIIFFIFSILFFNYHFFNDPLFLSKTQITFYPCYSTNNGLIPSTLSETLRYFYVGDEKLSFMFSHIVFFYKFLFLFWIFGVISMIGIFWCTEKREYSYVFLYISIFMTTIFLYGHSNIYYGFMEYNLQNSFLRYSLFSFLLLFSFFGFFIDRIKSNWVNYKKILISSLLIIILSLSLINTYNFNKNGIKEYTQNKEDISLSRDYIQGLLDNNTFIITTAISDKVIPPSFDHIISVEKYYTNDQVSQSTLLDDLNHLVSNLLKDNKTVFFVIHKFSDKTETKDFLNSKFNLTEVNSTKIVTIYNVTFQNVAQ